jgi:predicted ABC-type transport system involved in lysophospholipase L1 biosynthesis ATPase subunit
VPELTAIENIIIPSLMEGTSKSAATKQAVEILKDLENN